MSESQGIYSFILTAEGFNILIEVEIKCLLNPSFLHRISKCTDKAQTRNKEKKFRNKTTNFTSRKKGNQNNIKTKNTSVAVTAIGVLVCWVLGGPHSVSL